jgi:acetyltransferase-like isoleucine patch superfamily enzyme
VSRCILGYAILLKDQRCQIIKDNIVIGAGSVVTKNCHKKNGVYIGNAAKLKKIR